MARVNVKEFRRAFAQRLRAYRMLAGFETAREFSRNIEEDENTYTRWERGENMPSIEQLMRICLGLDITPNNLIWEKMKRSDPKDYFLRQAGSDEDEH